MKANYEQIVNVSEIGKQARMNLNDIFALAEKEEFAAAKDDAPRRLVLAIDVQKAFMVGGALAVPGSIGDVERMTRFIYNNMAGITRIMCSLDTHTAHQIFHPCWWVNSAGDHPAPYTVITYDDVQKNRWSPLIEPIKSVKYLKGLEQKAKKQLCIWPYHCIQGTEGATLENEFAKMVYFHSVARKTVSPMVQKGTDPYSEMYGIIEPEFSESNFLNTPVLNAIEEFDEIYVVGEAASHCLMESVRQIATHFANRPEITQKITILEDCTSPIPGYEAETKAAFDMFKSTYGIKFAKSTDIQFA